MSTNLSDTNMVNNNSNNSKENYNVGDPDNIIRILAHGISPSVMERIARIHMEFMEEEIRQCKERVLTGGQGTLSYYILDMWLHRKWVQKSDSKCTNVE